MTRRPFIRAAVRTRSLACSDAEAAYASTAHLTIKLPAGTPVYLAEAVSSTEDTYPRPTSRNSA